MGAVVTDGDDVAVLGTLRERLQARLDDPATPAAAVAALSREMRAVMAALERAAPGEVSTVDDLAAQRAARRADAAGAASTARRSQPRRRGGGNRAG